MQEQEHENQRGEAAGEQDEDVKCSNELLAKIRERMAERRKQNRDTEDIQIDDAGAS
jgi:hypothetical protein